MDGPYAPDCPTNTNTLTGHQARPAVDRPPRTRSRDFFRNLNVRPLPGSQDQARTREACACQAAEEGQQGSAKRDCARSQTNTHPQAQGSWQVEGHRRGADQQRPSSDWQQVAGCKDNVSAHLGWRGMKYQPTLQRTVLTSYGTKS